MSQLQFIDQQRLHYPVQLLCHVLQVVPSRYYAWRQRPAAGAVAKAEPAWETALVGVFDEHQRRYGTRRLQVELRELGHHVGRQALRRQDRQALQPKAFVPRTTDSTHGKRCAANLLLDQPRPTQVNRVWVSDITYLPLATAASGSTAAPFRTYAANRWWVWCRRGGTAQVRADMPEALVTTALQRALLAQRPAPGLIGHSDRGGQYVGNVYKTLLRNAKAQLSHSRRGECDDNAQAESRWSRLKTELLEARDWPIFTDLADAQASVATYFDYYNHKRRHSSIGYSKP